IFYNFPTENVRLDLTFLAVLYLGFYGEKTGSGLVAILLLGVMTDALGGTFWGFASIPYLILYLIIRGLLPRLFFASETATVASLSLLSFSKILLGSFLMNWLGEGEEMHFYFFLYMIPQVLLNVFLALLLFFIFEYVFSLFGLKQEKEYGLLPGKGS
ncbi:MAG: hypothetical protein Q7S00_07250, partial [bacterium]|nr:hypothetical protein [bacterium]